MRLLELTPHAVGKQLARTVYDGDGRVLLRSGTVLSHAYIRMLLDRGFTHVFVPNELVPDLVIDEPIQLETRVAAERIVKHMFQSIRAGERVPVQRALRLVEALADEVLAAGNQLFSLATIRTVDALTFTHSVNVTIYSVLIATRLRWQRKRVLEMGMGALLHDVGKVKMPDVVNKEGPLDEAERRRIEEHPGLGFQLLKDLRDVPLLAAHVALQHHERLDGSGYPRGLRDPEIHEFAKVVAVADVYDAMTAHRPYRPGLPPHEAGATILQQAGSKLDREAARLLFSQLALYPTGSYVRLEDGRLGLVTAQVPTCPEAPRVLMFTDENGNVVQPYQIDLKDAGLAVKHVLLQLPSQIEVALAAMPSQWRQQAGA